MEPDDFRRMKTSFERFTGRLAEVFPRKESVRQMEQYLRALLLTRQRRTGPRLAATAGEAGPDKMQRLLYLVSWDADAARDILQDMAAERLMEDSGVAVLKQVSFAKKGTGSVGVATQWNPAKGGMENCQIAALLVYVASRAEMILDRGLFLPEEWIQDFGRRQKARVPASVVYRDMPEIALSLITRACNRKIPMPWVSGDEVFGNSFYLREGIRSLGLGYVFEISSHTRLWMYQTEPGSLAVAPNGLRHPAEKHDLWENPQPVTAAVAAARCPAGGWRRFSIAGETRRQVSFDWTAEPVLEDSFGRPGPKAWLLSCRTTDEPLNILYHLACGPPQTPLAKLAQVAATNRLADRTIDEAREVAGLDQYHVRHWHSWHRHVTLSMMAYGWLKLAAASGEKITRFQPSADLAR